VELLLRPPESADRALGAREGRSSDRYRGLDGQRVGQRAALALPDALARGRPYESVPLPAAHGVALTPCGVGAYVTLSGGSLNTVSGAAKVAERRRIDVATERTVPVMRDTHHGFALRRRLPFGIPAPNGRRERPGSEENHA